MKHRLANLVRTFRNGSALLALSFLSGCASYQSLPITEDTVQRPLAPPAMTDIRLRASGIEHPVFPSVEFDDRDGLSPDEAAVLALLINPHLRAARDRKGLADAQLLQAGLLPNPELSYGLEIPVGGDTAGTVSGFGIGLGWDVASLIGRSARTEAAEANQGAVNLEIAWQEWQVAHAARAAVYALVNLNEQVSLAEEMEQNVTANLASVHETVARGTRTAKDLSAVETASRQATEALLELRRQTAQQRLQLNRTLGLPSSAEIVLQQNIKLPLHFDSPPAEILLNGLEQRRLDLLALRRGYDSQEATVRAAIRDQFPRVNIGPTMGRGTENVETTGFGITIDLPIFNRNQGGIAAEQATRERLFDEYVNRVFETRSDVEMILSRIRFLNQQIAAAQAAEPDLRKRAEHYRAALAEGRTDALTSYAAWNALASTRMRLLVFKGQLAAAVGGLELATGMYRVSSTDKTHAPAEQQEETP